MQNFVSANPPSISHFVKKRKMEQANKAFKAVGFVVGFILLVGWSAGMLTGWLIWG